MAYTKHLATLAECLLPIIPLVSPEALLSSRRVLSPHLSGKNTRQNDLESHGVQGILSQLDIPKIKSR
jgi:hypothetical protein